MPKYFQLNKPNSSEDSTLKETSKKGVHYESEVTILQEWKGLRKVVIFLAMIGCFFLAVGLTFWMTPILDLKDLEVVEGELVTIVPNGFRRVPSITLKVNGNFYFKATSYVIGIKPLLGKKIKVWTQEECYIAKYGCVPHVKQMESAGRLLLKYDVKKSKSRRRNALWFAFGLPFFFFILAAIGAIEGIKRKNKKLKALLND